MPGVNDPFQIAVTHSSLAFSVNLYDDTGALAANLPVAVVGQSGTVRHPYPSGLPAGAYLWHATEVNPQGEGPAGAKGGFATSAPTDAPTLAFEQFP